MKLSQPKSARIINRARVLGTIRKNPGISKADLARVLNINKVSVGEIVDALISEGCVKESGKTKVTNGRQPTSLVLVQDFAYVLALDIGPRNCTMAVCDVNGKTVNLERFPTNIQAKKVEEFCVELMKSAIRLTKLVPQDKLLGAGVTVGGRIDSSKGIIESCPYLPWQNIPIAEAFEQILKVPCILENSTAALIRAEAFQCDGLVAVDPIMYLEWGERLNLGLVVNGKAAGCNSNIGHLKVATKGLCSCGNIGCLEAVASSWAITGSMNGHLKDSWDKVSKEALVAIAKTFAYGAQITGSRSAIVGGEGSVIPQELLDALKELCPNLDVHRSVLGDKANISSAAEIALDKWIYMSSLLDGVKDYL
ncbi:MAG: ROK family transcriptional regulator [Sphaerochaetaceae bacterium]|nr:ROK family transcriptional regulator [Sphaerochaetaceae bacterium]